MITTNSNEIRYAKFKDSSRALLFLAASDRDDFVSRHNAAGYQAEAITACQAYRMTPPQEDGSRLFIAPNLPMLVREP